MRLKICRKEAKESRLFSRLVDAGLSKNNVAARESLGTEARELTLIFSPSSPKADDRLSFFWIWRLSFPWGLEIGIWSFGNDSQIEISLYTVVEDRCENLICSQRVLRGSRTPDRLRGCSRVAKLTWACSILGWNRARSRRQNREKRPLCLHR